MLEITEVVPETVVKRFIERCDIDLGSGMLFANNIVQVQLTKEQIETIESWITGECSKQSLQVKSISEAMTAPKRMPFPIGVEEVNR